MPSSILLKSYIIAQPNNTSNNSSPQHAFNCATKFSLCMHIHLPSCKISRLVGFCPGSTTFLNWLADYTSDPRQFGPETFRHRDSWHKSGHFHPRAWAFRHCDLRRIGGTSPIQCTGDQLTAEAVKHCRPMKWMHMINLAYRYWFADSYSVIGVMFF